MLQLVITRKCNHEDKCAITIEETRGFHYFKHGGATRLGMKRISDDQQFSLETDIISSREDIPAQNINIGQYVSALYDDNWYIGIVQHIDKTNKDVFLQLMHPKGPSHYFYWPENEDVCWVPFQHILCGVTQPTLANSLGQYQLCARSTKIINNALLSHSKKKFVNV